jgi:peptide chain release factor 1
MYVHTMLKAIPAVRVFIGGGSRRLAPQRQPRRYRHLLVTTTTTKQNDYYPPRIIRPSIINNKYTIQNPTQQFRFLLTAVVNQRLETLVQRHGELMEEMSQGGDGSFSHGKELSSLMKAVSLKEAQTELQEEVASIQELLQDAQTAGDKELEQECLETLQQLEQDRATLETKILNAILPRDEDDFESDAILEIRAGTGGEEASIFASEIMETYIKTAKSMNWSCEILTQSKTDLGGIREANLSITGRDGGGGYGGNGDDEDDNFRNSISPYGLFKYESGVHRVQRVPVNDTRIHTSACSVAALPLKKDDGNSGDLLPMSELKIETMRSSGAGGQSVNTTDSAVRITHIPTGITASIQDERSQHKNKDKALKLIAARVRDLQRQEEEKERGELKGNLLGGGDRSERIRTYNYPQDRVTDHRCKHTTHGITKLLDGGSEDGLVVTFFPFLRDMKREELMKELEAEDD